MDAEDRRSTSDRGDFGRRQQRPAEQGPAGQCEHRPRCRFAAGSFGQPDRQHAVRCLRPASGLDRLCGAQPVPRDHGGGAGVPAEPADPRGCRCQHLGRTGQRFANHQCGGRNYLSPAQKTAGNAASVNSVAASAVRNLATNSIGATGKGASSTGTAVSTSQETMIPLSSVAQYGQGQTSLVVNHQGVLVANTISFNLAPGIRWARR